MVIMDYVSVRSRLISAIALGRAHLECEILNYGENESELCSQEVCRSSVLKDGKRASV